MKKSRPSANNKPNQMAAYAAASAAVGVFGPPVTLTLDVVTGPSEVNTYTCSPPGNPNCPSGKGAGPATWRRTTGTLTEVEVASLDFEDDAHIQLVADWVRQLVERELGESLDIPANMGITVDRATAEQIDLLLKRRRKECCAEDGG
jgi:hypothetical protein